ncbi:MAG TPA: alcohol dehydrogenase catalytic domain-containing protein [Acidimicrobiia bacterium]|nr:alcohol dehydrogenase catalytic domain-containing protein [Acidimicrobiia bacterium]
MRTRAAVMREHGRPLSIETLELDEPRAGEVLLRMEAVGICGSDRHVLEGRFPGSVPCVGGHEGAGVVESVGPGVHGIAVGDHVLQTFVGPCGVCGPCRRNQRTFCAERWTTDGRLPDGTFRLHDGRGDNVGTLLGLGSFGEYTVTPARNCLVVPGDVDPACAALVACGVSTGVGAAVNVAGTRPGDDVAVIGVGGVGAAAVLGAVLAGAARVVAVDIHASKADAARDLGATHFVNARDAEVAESLAEITDGRGVDRVILTLDRILAEHYRIAIDALAPGGVAVQVGATDQGLDYIPVSPDVLAHKQASFTGTVFGGMDPPADARRWLSLYRSGRLPLDKLITRTYTLDAINDAFADLAVGRNIRGVVRFDAPVS